MQCINWLKFIAKLKNVKKVKNDQAINYQKNFKVGGLKMKPEADQNSL